MSFWNKLKIDTAKLSVSIDEKEISEHITRVSFDWTAGKHPAVRIELDSEVVLEGIMLKGSSTEIICPKCGKVLDIGHTDKIIHSTEVKNYDGIQHYGTDNKWAEGTHIQPNLHRRTGSGKK